MANQTQIAAETNAAAQAAKPTMAEAWNRLIDLERRDLESTTDLLAITRPRAPLDPLAKKGVDALFTAVTRKSKSEAATVETALRRKIIQTGVASEISRVTGRLNAMRMTDARRWALAETYVWQLAQLLDGKKGPELEKLVADDRGVAEAVMLAIDAHDGALHRLALLLVEGVVNKNKIALTEEQKRRAAQQVRGAI